jgi:hypothetical protein
MLFPSFTRAANLIRCAHACSQVWHLPFELGKGEIVAGVKAAHPGENHKTGSSMPFGEAVAHRPFRFARSYRELMSAIVTNYGPFDSLASRRRRCGSEMLASMLELRHMGFVPRAIPGSADRGKAKRNFSI